MDVSGNGDIYSPQFGVTNNPPKHYPCKLGSTTGDFYFTAQPASWDEYEFIEWSVVICSTAPTIVQDNPLHFNYGGGDPVTITAFFHKKEETVVIEEPEDLPDNPIIEIPPIIVEKPEPEEVVEKPVVEPVKKKDKGPCFINVIR